MKRLRPEEVVRGYQPKNLKNGPSYTVQGLTDEQRARIGDFTVWDSKEGRAVPISRDEVGHNMNVEAALTGIFSVTLADGSKVEVMPIFEMYKRHLADYDLKTVEQINQLKASRDPRLDPLRNRQCGDVAVFEQDSAAIWREVGRDQIDERGLAGAVRTDERQELSLLHCKVDPVAGIERTKALAQLDGTQQAQFQPSFVAQSRFAVCDNAPTMPVGNSNIRPTRTAPSNSCQYSVDATA